MKLTNKILLSLVLVTSSAPLVSNAASTTNTHAIESMTHAQQWLDKMGPIKGHFTQIDDDNKESVGKFYLVRPGRLRFDYEQPPLKVIANNGKLAYLDSTIDQVTVMDLDKTPLSVLLNTDAEWQTKVEVKGFSETDKEEHLEVVQKEHTESGALTLTFAKAPFALKEWEVTDFEGKHTKVKLSEISPLTHVSKSLFKMPQ